MREHEVPTHVQAEGRVLLGLTFPQVVAVTAVCALAYGLYRYAPIGPAEARIALAVLFGLLGLAAVAGRIGGRPLPLVAADLLRFRLGPRRYAGTPSKLARSEPPAQAQAGPGPARLMAKSIKRRLRRMKTRKKLNERRNGRLPARRWPPLRRRRERRDRTWRAALAAALTLTVLTAGAVPHAALAHGHGDEGTGWTSDEITFQPPVPVEGRRLFIEELTVSGDSANVALRAAVDIGVEVRALGGPDGQALLFAAEAALAEGERASYDLPLDGPSPSLTFAWRDELQQAGAVTIEGAQLPRPLPSAEGELCSVKLQSLGWRPGFIEGTVATTCVSHTEETVELQTVTGHADVTEAAVLDAVVTGITGVVRVSADGDSADAALVPNGLTRFTLPVDAGRQDHDLAIAVDLDAALRIPRPPVVRLTHIPEREEVRTETVRLHRPGTTETVSETVTVSHDDGSVSHHVVSATPLDPRQDGPPRRRADHRPPGADRRRAPPPFIPHPQPAGDALPDHKHRFGRPFRRVGVAGTGARAAARRAVSSRGRPATLVRHARMGVAVVRRTLTAILLAGVAAAVVGAAPAEEQAMLAAFDRVLTAMAYAATGLCLFAVVWAGFLLMAEGGEERGGKAKSAVALAVVGLVLVLLAKTVAALLRSGLVGFPTP